MQLIWSYMIIEMKKKSLSFQKEMLTLTATIASGRYSHTMDAFSVCTINNENIT